VHAFFDAVKAFVPAPISWSFVGEGDVVNTEDGTLFGSWLTTGLTAVSATGSDANMADAVGALVDWNTSTIAFGHRVKGRTFLVPGIKDVYAQGTLNDTVIPQIELAANNMINGEAGNFQVWVRPFAGTPQWTDVHGRVHPAKAAHAGLAAPINSASVPDKGVVLRSRRD